MMLKNTIVLILGLLLTVSASSNILKVENLGNSGAGTLRDQITAANANDTILINIKGTILIFGSPIVINKNLTIIGATASHTTIDLNSNWFDINMAGGFVNFMDMKITSFPGSLNAPVMINGSQTVTFKNVLFEGMGTALDGGAIQLMGNGILNLENCSFFNNSTDNNGGALYVDNAATANVRNCTFFGNFTNGAGVGGAICNNGNVVLVNNTFLNNTSGSAIGHAVADNNIGAGSATRIQNNIFTDATPPKFPDLLSGNSGNMWISDGGNVFSNSTESFLSAGPNDRINESLANINLRVNAITDGYGLKYFTLISQASAAIDNGTVGPNVSQNDCRRAPRLLFGDTGLDPDAGAVEFTPYTITAITGPAFIAQYDAMNNGSFAGPKYMDFDITGGGPVNFSINATLYNDLSPGAEWIVDGFTQDGSIVPGPGITVGDYTPGNYQINIISNSADIFHIDDAALNSFIAGLWIDNGGGYVGITSNNGDLHIYGNHIISSAGTGAGGIRLTGSNTAKVGGELHYHRNVIGNQVNVGVHAQNNYVEINGNFIGTTATGLATLSNDKGILLQGSFGKVKGRMGLPSMNLISGNLTTQIEVASGNFDIKGNIIGPDVTGNNLFAPTPIGISSGINTGGVIGGTNLGDMNIIGGNSDGILLSSCNLTQVLGNFIGVSPDPIANFPLIPNTTGIHIDDNGDFPNIIGDGTFAGRNYISGNSSIGIYLENGQGHNIVGNFIGIKPNNLVAGNGTRGIHIFGATAEGTVITGNVIGGHSTAGIDVNGAAGSGNISGNKIGTDSTGMVARPNGIGIQVAATGPLSQIIGNLISGNTSQGIFLDNSYHDIDGNIIGLSLDTLNTLSNGADGILIQNTNNCNIFNNYISGNGNNGIILGASNGSWIHGNHIGTNRTGMNFGNQADGITLFFVSSNNMIGGPATADQNDIMFNLGAGISVERENSVTGIRGNRFFQNVAHGISLNPAIGVGIPLINDLNDTDASGGGGSDVGNNGQNTPDAISAVFSTGTCTVSGTMNVDNTTANYLIQVYKVNPGNIDATGRGEGDTLIAEQTFNASGLNTFNFTMNITGPVLGDVLSLTASKLVSTNYETSEFSDTVMVRAPYTASIIDSSDVLCNGAADGRLEVLATGSSNLPYLYQWHDGGGPIAGATGSIYFGGPGTYFCVVTDAAAVVVNSDTATIVEPPLLTVTPTLNNTLCSASCDGSIVLSETGGTPPYQYSIDNGSILQGSTTFLGLCSGIYQIYVVDNNGCSTSTTGNSFTINSPPGLSMTPSFTAESCAGMNDGTISVTPFGGTGPYNYQIDGGGYGPGTFFGGLIPGNHIVDIQDGNGCTSNILVNILAGELVTANFSLNNACEDVFAVNVTDLSTSSTGISAWNYTFTGGSPSSATIPNVSNIMFFTPGSNNIQLTVVSNGGCTAVSNQNVTIFQNPIVSVGADVSICANTPFTHNVTVTGGTPTYTNSWTPAGHFSDPTIEDAVVLPGIYNVSGAYTHILNVSDVNGCTDADTMILTVNPLPTVSAPADYTLCSGSSTILNGAGAISYSWDNLVTNGSSFTPAATTTYTVTGIDGNGCQATDQVTITVIPSPVAIAGVDASICSGQSLTLDGLASTGFGGITWYEVGVGSIASTITTSVSPTINTDYALQLINGSCVDSDTVTITVISAPDPTFGYSGTSFCENSSNPTITTLMTPGGTFTMPLSPGNINATTGEISMTTLGPGTYDVIYTLTTPCFADDTISISILSLPTVDAGNDTSICAGGTVDLNGNSSGINYTWTNFAGFFSNTNPTTDTPTASDTYTLYVTDGNGCSNTDTKVVTVNTIPTGTISGGGAFCEGDPNANLIVVANGYSGGGDWNNQFFQNSTPGAIATPATGTYTLIGIGNTSYNGVWTAVITDNITGCVGNATGSVNVNVNPEPAMGVASPVNACSGWAAFDMNTNFIPSIAGGVWSGTGVTGVNFNPISTGVGTFDVIYTTSVGCDDTITINVQAAPNPTITGLNSAYCVTDAAFMPTGSPAGGLWSIDGAPFATITTIDPSTFSAGTHSLSYQFTDGVTGCVGTTTPNIFVVSLVPLDPIAVSNITQSICGGGSLVLTVSNPNTAGTTIQWYSDAALTVNVGSTINFTTPLLTGSITYYAVAQNAGCKSNPVIFTITVNNPQVSAGADLTICPGTPAQLNLTSASGVISWSPGISLNDSTIQNPLATPNVNTTYVVTVTSGPCTSQDSVNVFIDGSNPDCGIVPSYNAFSPDGDGVNDDWIIDAIIAHPDNVVTIYNRWGDKLVSFDDYDNVNVVWDGTFKGEILPSGTYFYVVEYLDIQMQVSGWLQLTR
jgi:gliding motility-associated-like protein